MSIRLHSHCSKRLGVPLSQMLSECFFQRMFETDCKETKSGKAKLNLSQEGLKAFLEFVYCLRIDTAKEDPKIALELLEFAHEKQISELEEGIKSIVVEKPDDWLSLNEGLQLFLFSLKLESQGYSDLKKKAVKAIKSKRLELKQSSVFQKLLESNPKCVTEFVCSCLEF
ncbi:Kelch repeat and BTB domain-containing protein 3 [Orchesella cincta]|uniref:Kelch repeat and BTB domain-containing protein 3 n=1 Tax=Orchesella cincta TaxID=48709 RepID=A0A1D2MJD1_ORCCI|nr:Kelch repeat and BTB domain-containing protein 3 [Orchesella cincta]